MMAVPKLSFAHLRRSRPLFSLSTLSYSRISFLNSEHSKSTTETHNFYNAFHFLNSRSFSSPSNQRDSHFLPNSAAEPSSSPSPSSPQVRNFDSVDVVESVVSAGINNSNEEAILPVRFLISVLDGFHDLTGLPWWLVIASTAVAVRLTLLPLFVLQLNKLMKISKLLPKCLNLIRVCGGRRKRLATAYALAALRLRERQAKLNVPRKPLG